MLSVPFIAVVNACRGVKNFVQYGGLQELSDKIHAKRLAYEAKEAVAAQKSREGPPMSTTMTVMTVCNACGTSTETGAHFCSKCGSALTRSACGACGAVQAEGSQFCSKCGASQSQGPATSQPSTAELFAGFSPYYQREFTQIKSSGEAYKGKWNWAAFLFGGIWALTKGLWLPTLICFVGAIFTGGIVGVGYWFVFGARGNYMYYCKEIKHRDLPV